MTENLYFILWTLVVFIQNIITFFTVRKCFSSSIGIFGFSILGSAVYTLPLALIIRIFGENLTLKSAMLVILPSVYIILTCQGNNIKKIILYILCIAADSLIEVFIYFIMSVTDMPVDTKLNEFTLERVIMTVFSLMLMLPLKFFLTGLWNKLVNKESTGLGNVFLVFPFCQILVYFIIIYENLHDGIDKNMSLILMLCSFIVMSVANIVYLHYISDTEEKNALRMKLRDMEYAHELEAAHYTGVEEKRYELAKLRHDLRNELSAVKNLISSGNSDNARELLNDIEKQLDATVECKYCSSPVIDAIISEKESALEKHGISFTHNIAINETDDIISPIHLCSIFGNLMDNAINANLDITDKSSRYIRLSSAVKGGILTIKSENPVDKSASVPSPLQSSGYGLKILHDIAEKYNGRFVISTADSVCTASVTLNLSK